jgi:hypothetical protein
MLDPWLSPLRADRQRRRDAAKAVKLPCRRAITSSDPPEMTNTRVNRMDMAIATGMNMAIAATATPGS